MAVLQERTVTRTFDLAVEAFTSSLAKASPCSTRCFVQEVWTFG